MAEQPDINVERARRAEHALRSAGYWDHEEAYAVSDMICDLRHLCDRYGWDFEQLLESGSMHHECENDPADPEEAIAREMHAAGDYPILPEGCLANPDNKGTVTCRCGEESDLSDPEIQTTWQQWQCPACGSWEDKSDKLISKETSTVTEISDADAADEDLEPSGAYGQELQDQVNRRLMEERNRFMEKRNADATEDNVDDVEPGEFSS